MKGPENLYAQMDTQFITRKKMPSLMGLESKPSFQKRLGAVIDVFIHSPRANIIGAISAAAGSELGYWLSTFPLPNAKGPTLFCITIGATAASGIATTLAVFLPETEARNNRIKNKAEPGSLVRLKKPASFRKAWKTGEKQSSYSKLIVKSYVDDRGDFQFSTFQQNEKDLLAANSFGNHFL